MLGTIRPNALGCLSNEHHWAVATLCGCCRVEILLSFGGPLTISPFSPILQTSFASVTKMPALVTKNSDLEFDSLQPCFYPDEDDFYFCGPPSEDIWKKFELLPTPPLSPSRAALPGATGDMVSVAGVDTSLPLGLGLTDPMDWASELLLLPEDDIWGASEGDLFGSALDSAGDNSIIIQDCMWSGFSAREKLERVVSEKLAMGKSATASPATGQEACSTKATAGGVTAPAAATVELNSSISECVDPAVVFPFPVHKRQSVCKLTTGGQTGTVTSPPVTHALDDTFSDSGKRITHSPHSHDAIVNSTQHGVGLAVCHPTLFCSVTLGS